MQIIAQEISPPNDLSPLLSSSLLSLSALECGRASLSPSLLYLLPIARLNGGGNLFSLLLPPPPSLLPLHHPIGYDISMPAKRVQQ